MIALVLLRLAIGWHFYREGTAKLAYDADAARYRIAFSAEPFLSQATGPLAEWFHDQIPNGHDWATLLAVPRQATPPTSDERQEQSRWAADDAKRRKEATDAEETPPIEFPPSAPYYAWAEQITKDWTERLDALKQLPGLSDEARQQTDEVSANHWQILANYFADEAAAIAEYQHELWRQVELEASPGAGEMPFQIERANAKRGETGAQARRWVNQVGELEGAYLADLRTVVSADEAADATALSSVDAALTDPRAARLATINQAATVLTLAVGVCLLVGFFTRLTSLAGAVFLLSVIASQPPWVAGAVPTYYQIVELAGLLVLAATGAGRWFGLDYFSYEFCRRFCRR